MLERGAERFRLKNISLRATAPVIGIARFFASSKVDELFTANTNMHGACMEQ